MSLDLSNMTQVGTDFSFKATVNGNVPSAIDKVDVDDSGVVTAILKNGQQLTLYTIMLADVASPDNLTPESATSIRPNTEFRQRAGRDMPVPAVSAPSSRARWRIPTSISRTNSPG